MAQYVIHDPEEFLECPYNRTHMVKAKSLPYHLVGCKKRFPGTDLETCPFNATHRMSRPEMRHHLARCPCKAMIEPEINYAARKESGVVNMLKGCTDTPVYQDIEILASEDWDAEIAAPDRVGPQYDITFYNRVQFRDPSRDILNSEMAIRNSPDEETLRLPKTTSKAAMTNNPRGEPVQQLLSSVLAYSTGHGTGRSVDANRNSNAVVNGQVPGVNGEAFVPVMPYGRGVGILSLRAAGIGRGMAGGAVGRGSVAPPPGFCVPKVGTNNPPGID